MEIEAYPNPNQGKFSLKISTGKQDTFTIDIFTQNSQLLYRKEKVFVDRFYIAPIDLYGAPSGTYVVRVYNSDASQTVKVLVTK